MKKKLHPILLTMVLLTSTVATVIAADQPLHKVQVELNGKPLSLNTPATMQSGTVIVPFREMLLAAGISVHYDDHQKTIKASSTQTKLVIDLRSRTATKNGFPITVDKSFKKSKGQWMVSAKWINQLFGAEVSWQKNTETIEVDYLVNSLPVVGSLDNLKQLLNNQSNDEILQKKRLSVQNEMAESLDSGITSSPTANLDDQGSSGDYSTTNVQVQGVDEADVVKTDGTYIYQVNPTRLTITQAYPAEQMKVIGKVKFDNNQFQPQEMYLDDQHLVVIGHQYEQIRGTHSGIENSEVSKKMLMPYPNLSTVKAIVFDITEPAKVKQIREIELEGYYVSSRKIGSSLYLIANKGLNYYYMLGNAGDSLSTPLVRDSVNGEDYKAIDYNDIRYFPDHIEPNYVLIAGINLSQPEQPMQVSSYLGSGQNIYASQENLYIAVSNYNDFVSIPRPMPMPIDSIEPAIGSAEPAIVMEEPTSQSSTDVAEPIIEPPYNQSTTSIYKFELDHGVVKYRGQGAVPGTILNQFSMDEYNGYFRIATTVGDMWRNDEYTSKNNLYVLDSSLSISGKVENIAPGERIYSVRFMGDRGYMVTFKNVDPLFIIDLHDPNQPSILGALKIPGYSDYLHPYDENHIIGFGKDTIEQAYKDEQGRIISTNAYYQGLKVAMFDVSDVSNPIEKFKIDIGDRGTESELLHNHKALLFSKDKNLLAFPVTLMEHKKSNSDITNYGEFTFQGAYIYHIDLDEGFRLRGRITHLNNEDMEKSGNYWYSSDKNVERILYIRDTLYTLSKHAIKANDLNALEEKNELNLNEL